MDGVKHHMLDFADPKTIYTCADYVRDAKKCIAEIVSTGKLPIICGGTGLYHDSLMKISSFSEGEKDEELREELYLFARENGNEALHARLAEIDPEAAEAIHPNNVKRVVRAIEIYETTGKTKTETDREQISGECRFDNTVFIIDFASRDLLYSRIEKRVDIMMNDGLLEEARRVLSIENLSRTAAQAIGYKEILPYFNNEKTLDEVSADIKLSTRHYAKRQLIWFRRYKGEGIYRLVPDTPSGEVRPAFELAAEALSMIEKNIL